MTIDCHRLNQILALGTAASPRHNIAEGMIN